MTGYDSHFCPCAYCCFDVFFIQKRAIDRFQFKAVRLNGRLSRGKVAGVCSIEWNFFSTLFLYTGITNKHSTPVNLLLLQFNPFRKRFMMKRKCGLVHGNFKYKRKIGNYFKFKFLIHLHLSITLRINFMKKKMKV